MESASLFLLPLVLPLSRRSRENLSQLSHALLHKNIALTTYITTHRYRY